MTMATLKYRKVRLAFALLLVFGIPNLHAQWTAYFDYERGTGTAASNVLARTAVGSNYYLTNQFTGEQLSALLSLATSDSPGSFSVDHLPAGTPAYTIFNGFCDLSGSCRFFWPIPSATWSIHIVNLNPQARYHIVGTVHRNDSTFANYITKVELLGASNCLPAHTANILTNGLANHQAGLINYNPTGEYIAWTAIDPGADGTISITCSRLTNQPALALGALRIEEYAVPAAIKVQPKDMTVCPGDPATFSIRASGSLPMSYQWYGIAAGITNTLTGETNSSLSFASTHQPASYFVVISNSYNVATSSVAQLTLVNSIELIAQPEDIATDPQSTVTFLTDASPISRPVTVQWYYNTVSNTVGALPLTNATNLALTLTVNAVSQSGFYFAYLSNCVGAVTSRVASLTVYCHGPIELIAQPQDIAADRQTTVTFLTEVSPISRPVWVQWYYNTVSNTAGAIQIANATNLALTLNNLAMDQSGFYFACLSNCVGAITSRIASLVVYYDSSIALALNCLSLSWTNGADWTSYRGWSTTNGYDYTRISSNDPTCRWSVSGTVTHDGVSALQSATVSGAQASRLITAAVGPAKLSFWWKMNVVDSLAGLLLLVDGGTPYVFINATNWERVTIYLPSGAHSLEWLFAANGSTNQPVAWMDQVSYTTNDLAPEILTDPASTLVMPGNNAVFRASAEGFPPLRYQWQFNGQEISGASFPQLTVPKVQPADAGEYRVMVMNDYGAITSSVAVLTIEEAAPWFQPQRPYVLAIPGGDAVIHARAFASAPVSYQWSFEGTVLPGETNASLILHSVGTNQTGHYSVAVTNNLGGAIGLPIELILSRVSYVIHISMDGLSGKYLASGLRSEPERYPNFQKLLSEGACTLNARCDDFSSVTVPNHLSMLTGRPVLQPAGQAITVPHGYTVDWDVPAGTTIHSTGNTNVPYKASVFDVVHDHGLSTAIVYGKSTLNICVDSYTSTNGAPDLILPDNGSNKIDYVGFGWKSSLVVDAFEPSLATNLPYNYAFLHFADCDGVGHQYGWASPAWFESLRTVDTQLGRLLWAIQNHTNPAIARETAVIVTADHGGYGPTHTDRRLEYNYTIPLLAWGPGFPAGSDPYTLFANRADPKTNRVDYDSIWQPLRNGDSGNLALSILGLPPIPGSTLIPLFPTSTPSVAIRAGAQPMIEWSAAGVRFTLETSATLGPSANWTAVTSGIVTNSLQLAYPLPPDQSSDRFFRLRKSQ